MTDVRLVQRAKGLLRTFNEAGVLDPADVHVAIRLAGLTGEDDESVVLATALAVRAVRSGSVCLDLRRLREVSVEAESGVDLAALPWPDVDDVVAALRVSPLVVGSPAGPLRPLRLADTDEGELLYLERYFRQEATIRRLLDERATTHPVLDEARLTDDLRRLFPGPAPDRQRVAAALAATNWTTVVAGGPGTGKTYTIARILALLLAQHGSGLRIALAAPTGKAAARLQESVRDQTGELALPELTAATVHRLLGWRRSGTRRFRFDAGNRLPYDVVVVDETSMVSLTMMCRLLEAVRPDARLVLVGDPDQLASVDAGAVLADVVARPVAVQPDSILRRLVGADLAAVDDPQEAALSAGEQRRLGAGIVRLSRGRRFGGRIAELAVAIREARAGDVLALLREGSPAISFGSPDDVDGLRAELVACAESVTAAATVGDVAGALTAAEAHRLLCAHRHGPYGVQHWARLAMDWVGTARGARLDPAHWYPGQPLLVTENDHETRVYNGDTGIVVALPDGALRVAFARGATPFLLHPSQLPAVQTVYAMTIHRSQGSQYDSVSVLLPDTASALLTRELLYTAVTRAREHVRVLGTEESVRAAVDRQVLRASGLRRTVRPFG